MGMKLDKIEGRFDLMIEMPPTFKSGEGVKVISNNLTSKMVGEFFQFFTNLNFREQQIAVFLKLAQERGKAEAVVGNCLLFNVTITPAKIQTQKAECWHTANLPEIKFPEFTEVKNKEFLKVNKSFKLNELTEEVPATETNCRKMLEQQARLRTLLQARNKTITRIEDFEREKEMLESGFVWELGCGFSLENIKQYIGMEYSLLKELNEEIGLKHKDFDKIFTWEELAKKF